MNAKFDEWFDKLPKERQDKLMFSAIAFTLCIAMMCIIGGIAITLHYASMMFK